MKIAVYPGTFDPITNGHLDVLNRALKIFDKVIILVAVNPSKNSYFTVDERVGMIKKAVEGLKNVEVDSTDGLTVDYAEEQNAIALIRGLRAVSDFEYEFQMTAANRFANPSIEEVFFMADKSHEFISSSTIKQLYNANVDISPLVPKSVIEGFIKKLY